jgi:hypothetical protein
MPRVESVIQVFVASPSDVKEERDILESVITELNNTWIKKSGLRLELNRWESSIYPGFGKDPQDVINQQINDEYDIFIGILWTRVGIPTPRSASGTIEEFERAYEKYKQDNDSVDLMIYFKKADIPQSHLDLKQYGQLLDFKSKLGPLGGLYREFEDSNDFESTLRSHLSWVTQRWRDKLVKQHPDLLQSSTSEEKIVLTTIEDSEENIEYGLLDYYDILQNQAEQMEESLKIISEATIDIGQQIERRTEELNISNLLINGDTYKISKIMQQLANDMIQYSSSIESSLPRFSASRNDFFESLSKALMLFGDFSSESGNEFVIIENQLSEFNDAMFSPRQGILNLKEFMLALPRISKPLNKAKRSLAVSLEKLLKELDSTLELTQNMLTFISQQK